MGNSDALVVFGKELPALSKRPSVIIAEPALAESIRALGCTFVNIEQLIEPGSLFEAGEMLERISQLETPEGVPVSRTILYRGYELWWTHYSELFTYFCLPYTQYRRLLEFLKGFNSVTAHGVLFRDLFVHYLQAHGRDVSLIPREAPFPLSLGILLQILFTLVSLPILMIKRPPAMVFTGDKFAPGKDHDFRMLLVYGSLRERELPFVEFIRSLEPWKNVLRNAFVRRRAVIYPQAISYLGRLMSKVSTKYASARVPDLPGGEARRRFEYAIATAYMHTAGEEIWAMRIMRGLLRLIGTKAAFISAASERNYQTALACKLNGIPTVGIMHGVASRYSTPYDFLPGFHGAQKFSVDRYGVWSKWWKDEYRARSRAYREEQLFISGPMRPLRQSESEASPLERLPEQPGELERSRRMRVLFIAEQSAAPEEIVPYLRALLGSAAVDLTIKFRPYRDGFEEWLKTRASDMLRDPRLSVVRGSMQEAIALADVVVGSHSTGTLEALLQVKPPLFVRTKKWGDYYRFAETEATKALFAENPEELVEKTLAADAVPREVLVQLQERYFGNPTQNGSAWVVDQLVHFLGGRYS